MSEPELENDNNEARDRARSRSRSPQTRRLWVQDLFLNRNETGNRLLTDITTSGIYETMNRFLRMKKEDFFHLLSLVGPKIAKMDTDFHKAITEQERLLITLRYLATGDTFTSLQYVFRVSRHTIIRIVKETCVCRIEVLRDYVKLPSTEEEWLAISRRFEQRWRFPHAIGAIDGKHVEIICPRNSGSEYHNYQKFFSIVLMVVVDTDYNFLWTDAGGKGGISDGGIFKNTRLYHKLLENDQLNIPPATPLQVPYQTPVPYFILGDKAFAFTNYCLRPYSGVHPPDSMERTFNKMHSTCRMPVENSLGILANRWRVLKGIQLQPDVAKTLF
ncbi:protein ALP1-like [Anopheles merus]|uniref:protein ALP1-like n=1 Tax=Anopheles merus TaxID=30066 RepID=UPI001BE46AB9|nr:protein ALP1-like [Anopheles merus]